MAERSSVFDMIGPVMIGPSSSHTAGVVKIARMAVKVLGGVPDVAEITFYNSFARTYEGHGSDKAVIGGLLDYATDDKRIKTSFENAKEQGLEYKFRSIGNASTLHPNSIRLKIGRGKKEIEILGESLGGGVINIKEVNGFKANFSGNLFTLIIMANDLEGTISFVSGVISHENTNIANMSVTRKAKKGQACQVIEMDSGVRPLTLEYLESLGWIHDIIYIPIIET
ncbi:L-serine dehydratase, iron-sulfur-dependent subunit beta [Fulvitalea axinellae]|uniref:L-serine dehydratase n=1 Tax=Fulvitalea axinellae TaxID=1182444 RepID=A0AAU9C9L3_9BACT|nr:L-serine dehydratase, iron-sulfur-dependent subunit beta [Fulvitalea axinellae]